MALIQAGLSDISELSTGEKQDEIISNTLLDSYTRAALQLDSGILLLNISGKNPRVKANGNRQLISEVFFGHPDEGAVYIHSINDVQLFINSTVAGDNKTIVVIGWKSDGSPTTVIATLSGKTQVPLSGTIRYVSVITVASQDATSGNVYAAESTEINEDGIPIDVTKIRALMRQVRQIGFNPILVVEPNKRIVFFDLQGSDASGNDVETGLEVKPINKTFFIQTVEFHIYQNSFNLIRHPAGVLNEGDVLQIIGRTNTENASITEGFSFFIIDENII